MAQNVVSLVNVHVNFRKTCVLLCGSRPEGVSYSQWIDGGVELLEKTPQSKTEQRTKRVEKIIAL